MILVGCMILRMYNFHKELANIVISLVEITKIVIFNTQSTLTTLCTPI